MTYTWNGGPVTERVAGRGHRLWWNRWNEGVTLIRSDAGVWSQVSNPLDSTLQAASAYLLGGHVTTVSDAHYTELVAAGYGAYLS